MALSSDQFSRPDWHEHVYGGGAMFKHDNSDDALDIKPGSAVQGGGWIGDTSKFAKTRNGTNLDVRGVGGGYRTAYRAQVAAETIGNRIKEGARKYSSPASVEKHVERNTKGRVWSYAREE